MSYELDAIRSKFYNSKEKEFFDLFVTSWNKAISSLPYQHPQFELGNRIRPRLVYWGFLANQIDKVNSNMNVAVEIAVSIELIHKTSIILDDYIDGDAARRGEPSFHINYGPERTMMLSLNIISTALSRINLLADNNDISHAEYNNYISILTTLMMNMSDGVMQELDLNEKSRYNITKIREICNKETALLLTNSILLGYYSGGGCHIKVLDEFETIGMKCGYLFQLMNDMEAWCQTQKNISYKGNLNLDVEKNRKNIVMCILYNSLSRQEKKAVDNGFGTKKTEMCLKFFKKYNIQDDLISETQLIIEDITNRITSLSDILSKDWCDLFSIFINQVYKLCLKRLSDDG